MKKIVATALSLAVVCSTISTFGASAKNVSAASKKVTLKFQNSSTTMKVGQKKNLKVIKKNVKKIKSMKWTSSKTKVASVNKKGVVTAKKAGNATITCKVKYQAVAKKKIATKSLKYKVTVKNKAVTTKVPTITTQAPQSAAPTGDSNIVSTIAPTATSSPEATIPPDALNTPVVSATPVPIPFTVKSNDTSNVGEGREVAIVGGTSDKMTVKDNGTMREDLSFQYLIKNEMGEGINLGNTMEATKAAGEKDDYTEATDFEQAWGAPITTQKYIDAVHSYGFNTIRIPVSWSSIVSKDGNYTIGEKMLGRVEEIVNYALNNGMYVIINEHYDYGWWGEFGSADPEIAANAQKRYESYWRQIAERFKNYSDHLIFESANEEFGNFINEGNLGFNTAVDGVVGTLSVDECYAMVNKMNQRFLDIVRESGANNEKRHLLIAGFNTDIDKTVDSRYEMPKDTEDNGTKKLSVSVHYYTPWEFCGDGVDGGEYTAADKAVTVEKFASLKRFTDAGYGVIVGEFAVCNPHKDGVIEWLTDVMQIASESGCLPVLWDTPGNYFDRDACLMNYQDVAELYNGITGANGNTADITTRTGKLSADITPIEITDADVPVWSWEGTWAKNDGKNIGIDGEVVTKTDVTKFVQTTTCTDESKIGFNDWGYQSFLKVDWSKMKSPCIKIQFKDEVEDTVGKLILATASADGKVGKDEQSYEFATWTGKGVILPKSMVESLKTSPSLYLTFGNAPVVTGIYVYDKE